MVTVTDKCGLTSSATINVDASIWIYRSTAQIVKGPTVCKDAPFTLSGIGIGGGGTYSYKWNNSETSSVIRPTVLGTYILTVTDNCNNTASAAVVVDATIWNPAPGVEIEPSKRTHFAEQGKWDFLPMHLPLVKTMRSLHINGHGNSVTSEVLVDGEGKYSVTVTDACNQTGTAEYETGKLGISCLKSPDCFLDVDAKSIESKFQGILINVALTALKLTTLKCTSSTGGARSCIQLPTLQSHGQANKTMGSTGNNSLIYPPDVYVWYVRYQVETFCKFEGKEM